MLERDFLSNTVKSLQAVRLLTLWKKDLLTGVSKLALCRSSRKQMFLNNSQNSQESTGVFFNKVADTHPCSFIKKGLQTFFCEFCKIFKNVFLKNTSGWLLLVFTCNFEKIFISPIFRAPLGNCLFHVKVAEFQPRYNKKYFTSAFQSLYMNTRRSYWEAVIYLKSLKIICEQFNL